MRRAARGFTLVEVVIAATVGLSLLALILQLVRFAAVSFHVSEGRLDTREAAARALGTLRGLLAASGAYRIEADGAAIRFAMPRRAGAARLDPATRTLALTLDGEGRPFPITVSGVVAFRVSELRPGSIGIELSVARASLDGESGPPLTVVDEVFVPVVARQDAPLPWNPIAASGP